MASLHRRASTWFKQQGLVVEAVQHALAAPDWECAAELIKEHGQMLLARGQVQTVLGWLNTLPETAPRAHPFLDVIHAGALINLNQMEDAELHLQVVARSASVSPQHDRSSAVLGTTTLTRAYIARFRGDLACWLTLSRQALEMLPPTEVIGCTAANLNIASTFLISGDVTPAYERQLVAAVAAVRKIGQLSPLFRGIVTLAELQRRQGRLRQAAATYRAAVQVMPDPVMLQAMPSGANYYFGLGDLLREWNDLEAAEQYLGQGREIVRGRLLAEAESVAQGYIVLAWLHHARGESQAAVATLQDFGELARERSLTAHLIERGAAARAQLALLQRDLDTAVKWANTSGLRPDDDLSYPREFEDLAFARVRIAQGRHDRARPYLRDALHLLERLLAAAEAGARMDSVIEILILQALALHAQGALDPARTVLARALLHAAPEGYVRRFVDEGAPMAALLAQALDAPGWAAGDGGQAQELRAYAQQLLAVLDTEGVEAASTPLPMPHLDLSTRGVEPLTERELEVLRLLAEGRSNQAIADELIVAVGTVKRHVNSILGKLEVQSRLEAVARARGLGLI